MEFIDTIMGKFAGKFDYEQLNLIRNIVVISLEDYDIKPKRTELATATAEEVNGKLLKMYVAELKVNGKSEKTIKQYVRNTTKLLEACNKVCVDITSNDVLLYFAKLQMSGTLTQSSIVDICKSTRPFFLWMLDNGYIQKNPYSKLHLKDNEAKKKEILTSEEILKLRDSCVLPVDLALLDFLVSTGVRVEECHRLNIEDINFDSNCVSVYAPKTKRYRTVFLTPEASKHIHDYLDFRHDDNPALFVFRGSRMSDQCIEVHLRRLAERAGINKHCTVHLFRRTLASTLHAKGMNDLDIATILGHNDVQTTIKYYINNDIGNLEHNFSKFMS